MRTVSKYILVGQAQENSWRRRIEVALAARHRIPSPNQLTLHR